MADDFSHKNMAACYRIQNQLTRWNVHFLKINLSFPCHEPDAPVGATGSTPRQNSARQVHSIEPLSDSAKPGGISLDSTGRCLYYFEVFRGR
jgi:hypothetical protein